MTIRSSSNPRITGIATTAVGGAGLLILTIGAFVRGRSLWPVALAILVIMLAVAGVVRGWPQTTIAIDTETMKVTRAGKTTAVPRRKIRGLVLEPTATLAFVDERGQTLIKIVNSFRRQDLEQVAHYLGVAIQ